MTFAPIASAPADLLPLAALPAGRTRVLETLARARLDPGHRDGDWSVTERAAERAASAALASAEWAIEDAPGTYGGPSARVYYWCMTEGAARAWVARHGSRLYRVVRY
jgi:hypothetical protein